MSHDITTNRRRRIAQLLLAGALLAPVATATSLASPDHADALTPRSSSTEIADEAVSALVALEAWQTDRNPADYVSYVIGRDRVAEMAALELGLPVFDLVAAWSTTHPTKQEALLGAITQLGVPYRRMMSQEGVGFDCSGLTTYAYARAGVSLPRSSGDQIRLSQRVDRDTAEAGDLVYYPGHVMMYLGVGDAMVHSPNTGNLVEIAFVTARRANSVVFADPLD